MANIEKGALIFYEWEEATEDLTDADFGKLCRAIIRYQRNGTPFPEFTGTLKAISKLIFPCVINRVESANNGKAGALKRWTNSPPNSPPNNHSIVKNSIDKYSIDNSISPPIIPPFNKGEGEKEKKNEKMKREENERLEKQFEEFWKEYPKKTAKSEAKKRYLKIKPSREVHLKMLEAVKHEKFNNKQWKDTQYIPFASTWLNREQWNDIDGDGANGNTFTIEDFEF